MESVGSAAIRNLVLMGHQGVGKTSLVEALALTSGAITRQGRVEDGTTVSDFDPDEQKRGMSFHTAVVSIEFNKHRINLIDTPGYADFVGEMIGGASAADAAVILIDGTSGVQVGTETAWRVAEHRSLPRLLVVNRMDRENADWETSIAAIRAHFGRTCEPLFIPIGQEATFDGVIDVVAGKAYQGADGKAEEIPSELKAAAAEAREALVERVAEADDALMLKYLEGETLSDEEIQDGLKHAIAGGTLAPIICTAATGSIGVTALLQLIVKELPSPLDVDPIAAEVDGKATTLAADPSGPVAALVFKTTVDEFVGRLSYIRLFSGTVRGDARLYNARAKEDERLTNLSTIVGKGLHHVGDLAPGDIAAVAKLSTTTTFDTLCDKGTPVILACPELPHPVFSAAIMPKSKADVDKLGPGLHRLMEEDPTLHMERDPDTGEPILSGLGESHLELAAEILRRKFKVDVETHDRRIPYRETITSTAKAEYLHKKQTGGHGQYARVAIRVEPLERGAGFEFGNEVAGGNVPKQYIPAVEKGVHEAMPEGIMAHYPVTDIRVVLLDGKHHDVDSSEMAFKLAASQALKEAAQQARPILLEPIMTFHITTPDTATGDVMSDLNHRRARVLGMAASEELAGFTAIAAEGPMAEFLHYATDLRSVTGGRGLVESSFTRYDPVPDHVAKKVVENAQHHATESVS